MTEGGMELNGSLTASELAVRKAAFRALLATGEPWDGERAELPGIDRAAASDG